MLQTWLVQFPVDQNVIQIVRSSLTILQSQSDPESTVEQLLIERSLIQTGKRSSPLLLLCLRIHTGKSLYYDKKKQPWHDNYLEFSRKNHFKCVCSVNSTPQYRPEIVTVLALVIIFNTGFDAMCVTK